MSLFGQLPMFKQRRDRPKATRPPIFVALASMYVAGERVEVELPMRIRSEPNMRGLGFFSKHERARAARHAAFVSLASIVRAAKLVDASTPPVAASRGRQRKGKSALLAPVAVTLTRIAPCALDDDNLRGAFKATRDGVADALGTDDRSPLIGWYYEQEKRTPRTYGVRILIEVVR